MIPKIGFENTVSYNTQLKKHNRENNTSFVSANPINKDFANAYKNYAINFTGKKEITSKVNKSEIIYDNMTPYAEEIIGRAAELAQQNGNAEITQSHILYVSLSDVKNYIKMLNSGEKSPADFADNGAIDTIQGEVAESLFANKGMRDKIQPIIDKELKRLESNINELPKSKTVKSPVLSKDYLNDIYSVYESINSENSTSGTLVDDEMLFRTAFYPNSKKYMEQIAPFIKEMKSSIYLDDFYNNKAIHIPTYDEKSKNILKNLNIGTNMVVIHDPSTNPQYILKSLAKTFEDKSNNFGNLTPENTEVTVFNKDSNMEFIIKSLQEMKKDKKKNHILIMENINDTIKNSLPLEQRLQFPEGTVYGLTKDSMDNAEKQGLNILVVGSVSNPELIGDAAMKSFKFIDSIEVSSPSYSSEARYDILKNSVKKNKMKIAGENKEEQDKVLKFAADITQYFPYIYIQNIVKKAQTVAFERGHKEVEKADFTEAYLQITTGRPSVEYIEPYEKRLNTSHECGHATNLEVMNSIAKNLGSPWHIPEKVNFVTLDPRGSYGGAVYEGKDKNSEYSFERNFANIVCSYGGHSAEKAFYDMDGSFGIHQDLIQATNMAQMMVKGMGQGPNTGKISLENREILSSRLKNTIESDEQLIMKNALTVSDMITEEYAPFNKYFTDKYSSLVGTGNCLIDGDTFRKELSDWRNSQSEEKQKELNLLDKMIVDVMNTTKQGKVY